MMKFLFVKHPFKCHSPGYQERFRTESYKIRDAISLELGAGAEYAKEGTFFVTRFGFEYAYELPHEWEVKTNLTYDVKWEAYNSFSLGVGVAKAFGFKRKSNQDDN